MSTQIFLSEAFFDPRKCRDCQFIFIKLTFFTFLKLFYIDYSIRYHQSIFIQ